MSSPTPRSPETGPTPGPAPERQSTPFLVLQFFVFPMAIVAVCVAVFVIFGLIASEGRGARDYLSEVRSGSANRRWQAAFELSKVLQAGKDPALKDPRFVAEAVALFQEARDDDPRVRRYLALALGKLGDPLAVPALLEALAASGPDADAETLIYSIWALGAIADVSAVPELARLAGHEDAGIRKAAAHALGALPTEAAREALALGLEDAVDDVRWNAAVALARQRDARALPALLAMLDRARMEKVAGPDPEQRSEAMLQAVAAAAVLDHAELRRALEALGASDPDLRVREAARRALAGAR